MSPKFYSFLWILYFVAAGVMWLAGVLTMLSVVVFGFVAFGMVFMGMMCVLPGAVSHPTPEIAKEPTQKKVSKPAKARTAHGLTAYRSA